MTVVTPAKRRSSTRTIPPALIYEIWDEKPVYYRGYRDVLAGKKTIDEVRANTALKSVLTSLLSVFLGQMVKSHSLLPAIGTGLHLTVGENLGNDIVIFEKEKVGKQRGNPSTYHPKL